MMISLLAIMAGCQTIKPSEPIAYTLPAKPERKEQASPQTVADYARIILYYELLVQDWESWARAVEKIIPTVLIVPTIPK